MRGRTAALAGLFADGWLTGWPPIETLAVSDYFRPVQTLLCAIVRKEYPVLSESPAVYCRIQRHWQNHPESGNADP